MREIEQVWMEVDVELVGRNGKKYNRTQNGDKVLESKTT